MKPDDDRARHWENVYARHSPEQLSWYQPSPETSLRLMTRLGIRPGDAVIDIGGGASTLVDHWLDLGFSEPTLLDISATALEAVKARLGPRAGAVRWLTGDVTKLALPGPFRLWHDRAVFHFLTDAALREAYRQAMAAAVPAGGFAIVATFADDGPEQCSDLPVQRYSAEALAAEFRPLFTLVESLRETHATPAQKAQRFIYGAFRRQ